MIQITILHGQTTERGRNTAKIRSVACHAALRVFVATILVVAVSAAALRKIGHSLRRAAVPAVRS